MRDMLKCTPNPQNLGNQTPSCPPSLFLFIFSLYSITAVRLPMVSLIAVTVVLNPGTARPLAILTQMRRPCKLLHAPFSSLWCRVVDFNYRSSQFPHFVHLLNCGIDFPLLLPLQCCFNQAGSEKNQRNRGRLSGTSALEGLT